MTGIALFVLGIVLGIVVSPWFFALAGFVVLVNIIEQALDS
jgi:hypothetical protein